MSDKELLKRAKEIAELIPADSAFKEMWQGVTLAASADGRPYRAVDGGSQKLATVFGHFKMMVSVYSEGTSPSELVVALHLTGWANDLRKKADQLDELAIGFADAG